MDRYRLIKDELNLVRFSLALAIGAMAVVLAACDDSGGSEDDRADGCVAIVCPNDAVLKATFVIDGEEQSVFENKALPDDLQVRLEDLEERSYGTCSGDECSASLAALSGGVPLEPGRWRLTALTRPKLWRFHPVVATLHEGRTTVVKLIAR